MKLQCNAQYVWVAVPYMQIWKDRVMRSHPDFYWNNEENKSLFSKRSLTWFSVSVFCFLLKNKQTERVCFVCAGTVPPDIPANALLSILLVESCGWDTNWNECPQIWTASSSATLHVKLLPYFCCSSHAPHPEEDVSVGCGAECVCLI